ncbi:MAG: DUF4168 domain-containing protein [Achromobacter sp.]|uniref:DUF4168 domain-containing protein n=1 Tax=Achromobacter TaxID=222 RepID=UPI0006F5801B|nr:DUF4168 domain-containing protein [Achromobacter sp. Root565]KRA02425.1 hypothetical protein ASD71_10485 [Achromobacter sp. Root565]
MQRSKYAFLSAAILTTALSGAPALAQQGAQAPAQTQSQAQTPPGMAPAVQKPTDQQLQKFASASMKISGVVDEYRPKVDAAKTDDAKQKVVKEADEKMVKLVRADGLTVEEFNGIGQAVQQDPQLRDRLMKMQPAR